MTLSFGIRLAIAAIIICIAAIIIGGISYAIYRVGYNAGKAEIQALRDADKRTAVKALVKENAATDRNQGVLDTSLFDLSSQFAKGEAIAKSTVASFSAGLLTGDIRLSVPTLPARDHQAQNGCGSSPPGGTGDETRAELVPKAAADIVAIVEDGNAAVRQLNKVIDAYNVVRKACNAPMQQDVAQ